MESAYADHAVLWWQEANKLIESILPPEVDGWSCLGLVDTVSVTPLTLGFPLVCFGTTESRSLPG